MSNTVEFVLRLKDMMSVAIHAAAANSRRELNSVSQSATRAAHVMNTSMNQSLGSVTKATHRMGNVAKTSVGIISNRMREAQTNSGFFKKSVQELEWQLREVNKIRFGSAMKSEIRAADVQAKKLERDISRIKSGILTGGFRAHLGEWRKGFMQTLPGSQFLSNPLTLAGGILTGIGKIAQMGMQAQQNIAGLKTFVGNQAAAVYNQIQLSAARTPFSVQAYKNAEMGLLSTGMAASKAKTDIDNLANAVAAVGGNTDVFERMSVNLLQARTQGKLMGRDIRQFQQAGINLIPIVAKSLHKTVQEVAKMPITYQMLTKALADAAKKGGAYYHGLYNQTHTLLGKIRILKSEFIIMLQKLGLQMRPILQPFVDFAEKVTMWLMTNMPKYGKAIGIAVIALGGLSAALIAASAAQWLLNIAQMANPVVLIIEGLITYIGLAVLATKHVHDWGAGLLMLMGPVGMLIYLIKKLHDGWQNVKDAFTVGGIIAAMRQLSAEMTDVVLEPLKQLLRAASHIPGFGWAGDIAGGIQKWENKNQTDSRNTDGMTQAQRLNVVKQIKLNTASPLRRIIGTGFAGVNLGSNWMQTLIARAAADRKKKQEGHFPPHNMAALSNISSGITSGGPKNITINVNKEMIGKLSINSYNVKEGAGQVENLLEDMLRRLLYSAAAS